MEHEYQFAPKHENQVFSCRLPRQILEQFLYRWDCEIQDSYGNYAMQNHLYPDNTAENPELRRF